MAKKKIFDEIVMNEDGNFDVEIALKQAPGNGPMPPLSSAGARQILGARPCVNSIAQCQEYLTSKGKAANGDALCADWNLFTQMYESDPKQASALLIDSLQHMMGVPEMLIDRLNASGKLQEYTTKGDFPTEILDTIEMYHTNIRDIGSALG